jgi:transposase
MVRIEDERDIETLRQIARLLDRENERLHARIAKLLEELATLKGQPSEAVQQELVELRQLLAQREQALFGDSSEKRAQAPQAPKSREGKPGHGPTVQARLPVVDEVHELKESERSCPSCGLPLDEMAGQYEDSEEVTVVERRFEVTRHRRQKYRCRCNGHVATAPGPVKLQEGGRYSADFAIGVAAAKYLDHTPLERQVRIMRREGLEVTSQTLWDQTELLARLARPGYDRIRGEVLSEPVIGADETYWRVMGQPDTERKRWWTWCVSSPKGAFYEIHDSRSERCASRVLQGYDGIVVADGYTAYSALARGSPGFTLVNCWAHVRRKYLDVEESFPLACREILDLIAELYAIERSVSEEPGVRTDEERLILRADVRRTRSTEVLSRIQRWVMAQRVLPESGLGKAMAYMMGLWPGLVRFASDARIPLDNNATERALRGPVVGRKNFYGARSRRGTEVAALFYTLFETAKLRGEEPKAYLKRLVLAELATPQRTTDAA